MKKSSIPEVFCSQLRLSIISCLINGELFFSDLKDATGSTDGNLITQIKKLLSWGYIESKKVIHNDKLVTSYKLCPKALKEFEKYVLLLESILNPD